MLALMSKVVALVMALTCALGAAANEISLSSNSGALSLSLDTVSYAYNVTVNGETWFAANSRDGYSVVLDGDSYSGAMLHTVAAPVKKYGMDSTGRYTSLERLCAAARKRIVTFIAYKTVPPWPSDNIGQPQYICNRWSVSRCFAR